MPQLENRAGHGLQADDVRAEKWRTLDGQNRLPDIIHGVEFRDEIRQLRVTA
jgi:hypothetical protein